MCRKVLGIGIAIWCVSAAVAAAQTSDRLVLFRGFYDFWTTPASSGTVVGLTVPAGFFGAGSDAVNTVVDLQGVPFGPNAGAHKPAAADTSVYRNREPRVSQPGQTDTVSLKLYALSLASINPITVTYNGGQNPQQWNVALGLSASPQPNGTMTVTQTYSNGGTFDSTLNVLPKFTFTPAGGGAALVLDAGNPQWGLGPVTLSGTAEPWVWCLKYSNGSSTQCSKFHPGVMENGAGRDLTLPCPGGLPELWCLALIKEKELLDSHNTENCILCIDPCCPEVEPVEPIDHEIG